MGWARGGGLDHWSVLLPLLPKSHTEGKQQRSLVQEVPSVNTSLLAQLQGTLIWQVRTVGRLYHDEDCACSLGSCGASDSISLLCAARPACRIPQNCIPASQIVSEGISSASAKPVPVPKPTNAIPTAMLTNMMLMSAAGCPYKQVHCGRQRLPSWNVPC